MLSVEINKISSLSFTRSGEPLVNVKVVVVAELNLPNKLPLDLYANIPAVIALLVNTEFALVPSVVNTVVPTA